MFLEVLSVIGKAEGGSQILKHLDDQVRLFKGPLLNGWFENCLKINK